MGFQVHEKEPDWNKVVRERKSSLKAGLSIVRKNNTGKWTVIKLYILDPKGVKGKANGSLNPESSARSTASAINKGDHGSGLEAIYQVEGDNESAEVYVRTVNKKS